MKVVILAGGVGNRLGGDTEVGPKPMVSVGGRPLIWHVMSHYGAYGFNEFVIAVGRKGELIKRYLADLRLTEHDVRIDISTGSFVTYGTPARKNWVVDVIDTGELTETGGRVKRLASFIGDETFMLTFGDAVSDVDLNELLKLHRSKGKVATITAVHPPPRFGELKIEKDQVVEFSEKPMDAGWINGGFMVFEPAAMDYINGDQTPIAPEPLQRMAKDGELVAYRHQGFWQSMDSLRDRALLEKLWYGGSAPWRVWE